MSVATKSRKGPAESFGEAEFICLENGSKVRVEKWSVRKAMAMGKSIAKILQQIFDAVESRGGENVRVADMIGMLPELMETCSGEIVFIVSESLTNEDGPQLTPDDIYDQLTLDDLADIMGAIIERNVTSRMLGKWQRLLQSLPLTKAEEPTSTNSKKSSSTS